MHRQTSEDHIWLCRRSSKWEKKCTSTVPDVQDVQYVLLLQIQQSSRDSSRLFVVCFSRYASQMVANLKFLSKFNSIVYYLMSSDEILSKFKIHKCFLRAFEHIGICDLLIFVNFVQIWQARHLCIIRFWPASPERRSRREVLLRQEQLQFRRLHPDLGQAHGPLPQLANHMQIQMQSMWITCNLDFTFEQ